MHRTRTVMILLLMFACSVVTAAASSPSTDDAPRITKEEVKALIGDPGVVILDARTDWSWSGSDRKIKGAMRVEPNDVASWAGSIPKGKMVVVYCS